MYAIILQQCYRKSGMAVPWRNAVAILQPTTITRRWRIGFFVVAHGGRFPRNYGKTDRKWRKNAAAHAAIAETRRAWRRCMHDDRRDAAVAKDRQSCQTEVR